MDIIKSLKLVGAFFLVLGPAMILSFLLMLLLCGFLILFYSFASVLVLGSSSFVPSVGDVIVTLWFRVPTAILTLFLASAWAYFWVNEKN